MQNPEFRIDGEDPVTLRPSGFVSPRTAHGHLFKHVLRLRDLSPEELADSRDPEAWAEIIPNPPLPPGLSERRKAAMKKLARTPGCRLLPLSTREDRDCRCCSDPEAHAEVDAEFSELLAAYVEAAGQTIDWAARNTFSNQPFLFAFRQNGCPDLRIKATDRRRVVAVGVLCPGSGEIRLLSCFRRKQHVSLSTLRLELCRERAGLKHEGNLAKLERAYAEQAGIGSGGRRLARCEAHDKGDPRQAWGIRARRGQVPRNEVHIFVRRSEEGRAQHNRWPSCGPRFRIYVYYRRAWQGRLYRRRSADYYTGQGWPHGLLEIRQDPAC